MNASINRGGIVEEQSVLFLIIAQKRRGQLDKAKAITNHVFGLNQFVIGKPIWESYLKGEEADPKVAMQKVVDAVKAEMKKG